MKPNLREADLLKPQPPSVFQGFELKSMATFPSWALTIYFWDTQNENKKEKEYHWFVLFRLHVRTSIGENEVEEFKAEDNFRGVQ